MTYAMTCTCGQTLRVTADDFESAVQKMMDVGKVHGAEVHPNENIPADVMEKNVRSQMKEEGA